MCAEPPTTPIPRYAFPCNDRHAGSGFQNTAH
jgi:hypothetical protein